jgi:hypothetical protein
VQVNPKALMQDLFHEGVIDGGTVSINPAIISVHPNTMWISECVAEETRGICVPRGPYIRTHDLNS